MVWLCISYMIGLPYYARRLLGFLLVSSMITILDPVYIHNDLLYIPRSLSLNSLSFLNTRQTYQVFFCHLVVDIDPTYRCIIDEYTGVSLP